MPIPRKGETREQMNERLRAGKGNDHAAQTAWVDVDFNRGRWAQKTRDAYRHSWKNFVNFCEPRGLQIMPADSQTIADFLAHHAKTHKTAGVSMHLAAIRAKHRLIRAQFPPDSDEAKRFIVDMENPVLADGWAIIRRDNGTRKEPKAAMTWRMLEQIIPEMTGDFYGLRASAILLTCFGAALRRGELIALNRDDLTFSPAGVSIVIRRSKTDQAGQGVTLRIPRKNGSVCPVATLEAWLEHAPGSEAVFVTRKGTRCDDRTVADIVKAAVSLIGKDPKRFSGHSPRRGFVTTAFENGAPPESIRDKTRHASMDMLLRYREAAQVFDSPADKAVFGL